MLDGDIDQVNLTFVCDGLEATVVGDSPGQAHEAGPTPSHQYIVSCMAKNLQPWQVLRPYHKFRELHEVLTEHGVDMSEAPMPRKHILRGGGNPLVVSERIAALRAIVHRMLTAKTESGHLLPEVIRFLEVGRNMQVDEPPPSPVARRLVAQAHPCQSD